MKPWAKIREWSRLFSEYATAQSVIQLLGILSGLWLVNFLPVREYALYTFAMSVFTFLSVFSDLGASNALLYFRRETRIAKLAFAPYVRAALRFRHGLLLLGGCAGLAFMTIVGRERGFGAVEIAAIGAVLVGAVWIQVGASVALLQLRLEGLYRASYVAEMCGNAMRLAAVAAMWLATAPLAWLAMLSGAAGGLVTHILAGRNVPRADESPQVGAPVANRKTIEGIARYVLPAALSAAYFSIQAPLTVWLSAYFAGTQSVAEIGALGRLGLIFGLLSGFTGTVLIPRLSAVTDDAHYLRRYLQCWAVLLPFGVGMIAIAYLVPDWLLLLLGNAYRGLDNGVMLIAISSVLSTWGGYLVGINNARGWVRQLSSIVAIYALVQVFLVMKLDLSTTIGVLYFGLWSSLAGLILQVGINAAGFLKPAWVAVRK
jgi:O-antigen/teichoic acid export membrane protein